LHILKINNKFASAKIALQGAHIFACTLEGKELLFVSKKAYFSEGKAIRGGTPLCWPYFGQHRTNSLLPQHGFARTSLFTHESTQELEDGSTKVTLCLYDTPESLQTFDYKFKLTCEIIIGKKLTISLTTQNLDTKDMLITQALHTYLQVTDISQTTLSGLDHVKYVDSLDYHFIKESLTPLKITKEIDRIYIKNSSTLELHTPQKTIVIEKSGSNSDVIWNPWIEKSHTMKDLADDEYKNFLCIEAANALKDEQIIKPNASHTISQTLSLKEL